MRASSSVDGLSAEPFALAARRSLTPLASPVPAVALATSSSSVKPGEDVTVTATVTNASADLTADSSTVRLNLPAEVQLVQGSQTQALGSLALHGAGGDHAAATWVVRATGDGSYPLTASTDAQHCSEHFSAQAASALSATSPQPPPSGSGNGGGGNGDGDTNGGGERPHPAPKSTPHLRIGREHWHGSRLWVAGSIAPGATGRVTVTYSAKRRGKRVRVIARTTVRSGRYSLLLKLPTGMRGVRATVTVSYAGDSQYKAQSARTHAR